MHPTLDLECLRVALGSASEADWARCQQIAEIWANWATVVGVLLAIVGVYEWLYRRYDRATDVLLELEKIFNSEMIREGRDVLEDKTLYEDIKQKLQHSVKGTATDQEFEDLLPLDELLRFYVLLVGIRAAKQVPDASLRACYRYWLCHYFNPERTEFRDYVDHFYPTLRNWLQTDRPWYRRRSKYFFTYEDFGFHPQPKKDAGSPAKP